MIDSPMGIARSHFGQTTIYKLLSGILDSTILIRKKQLAGQARTWEDK
jgi:hypothetical protein